MSIYDLCLKLNDTVNISELYPIAQKIIDVDFYGAMDAGENIDSITSKLIYHPIEVIEFLLSVIEEYQEQ